MAIDENTNPEKKRKRKIKIPKTTGNSKPNPRLPDEIIFEILPWLPVKSLLQFRSVSKLWRSVISSPQFIETHLSRSIESSEFGNHRLVLSSTRPHFNLKTCSVYSVINESVSEAIELDYPMKHPYNSVWIVGTCNGLVCLAIEEDYLFLWNPSTRKSRKLRSSDINLQYGCYIVYGFGYDKRNDDYIVVGIFCVFRNMGVYETEVKVYSSKSDMWKRIRDFPVGLPLDDSGKFAGGALHWAASLDIRSESPSSWVIVSLDLETETYGEVSQPKYGEGKYDLTLGVLENCLSVICNYEKTRVDVWVMKEYGEKESWAKLLTIPYTSQLSQYQVFKPLFISVNGDVLLEFESRLVIYSSKDNKFKDPKIRNFTSCLEADTYVESLVSPNVQPGA